MALVTRTGRLQSVRKGIPANLAGIWLRDSKLIEDLAECSFPHQSRAFIGSRAFDITSFQASTNLFDVLGESASRQSGALLTYAFWQRELHSDPKSLGSLCGKVPARCG